MAMWRCALKMGQLGLFSMFQRRLPHHFENILTVVDYGASFKEYTGGIWELFMNI